MERFAYLINNLLLVPFILFFFWRRPDLRRKMMTMGLVALLFGPISEFWFLKDYWKPQYALGWPWVIEDFLFAFLCGSGPTVAYQIFFRKKLGKRIHKQRNTRFFSLIAFGIIIMVLFNNVLGVNSIFASALAFLASSVIILYIRKDLSYQPQ